MVKNHRRAAELAGLGLAGLLALGAVGHYVAGHGISVPYLFPGA